jgi:hypothetical protein
MSEGDIRGFLILREDPHVAALMRATDFRVRLFEPTPPRIHAEDRRTIA